VRQRVRPGRAFFHPLNLRQEISDLLATRRAAHIEAG
jgi:hypothetical protein